MVALSLEVGRPNRWQPGRSPGAPDHRSERQPCSAHVPVPADELVASSVVSCEVPALRGSVGLPQALTVLEALLGQVFLVTLVARLVTLWVRQSSDI